ncbi:hypothetical protein [Streptomyces spiramyceticus]|uniref:hypothetical protein n=1 Tax=Streptomyces spiramyceticus TaxID=299717 RepID=UPI00237A7229|nr:hypothetical protein [Streptomyces spiramyceticus]
MTAEAGAEGPKESVTKAPDIYGGKVLASVANGKGNQSLPLEGGVGSGELAIAVNCQGKGLIKITLEPVGLSFPQECKAGEVTSTYNEFALKRSRKDASVKVEVPSTVRWSMTIGQ